MALQTAEMEVLMVMRVCKEKLEPHLETMLALLVWGALHLEALAEMVVAEE